MTQDKVPLLCILSNARSGTNHLCRLMESLQGVSVNLEPFHRTAPTHCGPAAHQAFEAASGLQLSPQKDPALGQWIHDNLALTIDVLRRAAAPGTRIVSFKVFQDQMPWDALEDLLTVQNDTRFLIVKRNPIDTYISFLKAKALQAWILEDTTDLRPTLDVEDFLAWHQDRSEWYTFVEDLMRRRGCRHALVDYDTDILSGDRATLERLRGKLRSIGLDSRIRFEVQWKVPIKIALAKGAAALGRPPPWRPQIGYVRQDRNLAPQDKVSNWSAFRSALEAQGALHLLDRFET